MQVTLDNNSVLFELVKNYWKRIATNPSYWIPLILFAIIGYGFSICNRTIHVDDLRMDYYKSVFLFSGRWGMLIWLKLVGVTDFFPFVSKFVALLFQLFSSFLLGLLFYYINNKKGMVLSYTCLSSMLLTYPLVNEIFEYSGANYMYWGNLVLVLLAIIYLSVNKGRFYSSPHKIKTIIIMTSSLILILPASSYEVGIFSYLVVLWIVILYSQLISLDKRLTIKQWVIDNSYYLFPLIVAIVCRFFIHFLILFITNSSFVQVGESVIDYSETTFSFLFESNFFKYFVAALVYFPITVFVVLSAVFWGGILLISLYTRNYVFVILSFLLYISLFSLSFVSGQCMAYRTAQTLTLFVAFVSFLSCEYLSKYRFVFFIFLFLCWHQAVYLNNILSLNNMRSNNEVTNLRSLGNRIVAEFGSKKPVVFIHDRLYYDGYLGPWINKRVHADLGTWNGRLFDVLVNRYLPEKYEHYKNNHYKFVNTNVVNVIDWANSSTIKDLFSYIGYDINIVSFDCFLDSIHDSYKRKELEKIYEKSKKELNIYQYYDEGDCLFVKYYCKEN